VCLKIAFLKIVLRNRKKTQPKQANPKYMEPARCEVSVSTSMLLSDNEGRAGGHLYGALNIAYKYSTIAKDVFAAMFRFVLRYT
jgi:hypothetical protein